MGACTSARRSDASSDQPTKKKKKKKSKSKVYSCSMDSITGITEHGDRTTGIPQRKTPYTRGVSGSQVTAFGFRRRSVAPAAPPAATAMQQQIMPAVVTRTLGPSGRTTGRCSPQCPPTPPILIHDPPPEGQTKSTVTPENKTAASGLPRPVNRFGFQLSPRCTAVLNNINAQLVTNTSVDPNCNPVTLEPELDTTPHSGSDGDSDSKIPSTGSTLYYSAQSSLTKICNDHLTHASKLPKLKPEKIKQSRNRDSASNSASIKPNIVKPVARPVILKASKTEANIMVALQCTNSPSISEGSTHSESFNSEEREFAETKYKNYSRSFTALCGHRLQMLRETRGYGDENDSPTVFRTAPTAKAEDLNDVGEEEKACIDESKSEKPLEAWVDKLADDRSTSSGSYSEGIEEQQFDLENVYINCSSESASSSEEPPPMSAKKSSGSLSQLSDGSSEQRDFLIDDEIADQPGLTFMADDSERYPDTENEDFTIMKSNERDTIEHCNHEETTFNPDASNYFSTVSDVTEATDEKKETSSTLIEDLPLSIIAVGQEGGVEAQASPIKINSRGYICSTPKLSRHRQSTSTGTLSPCESIISDDLMLDFEDSTLDGTPSRQAKPSMNVEDNSEFDESAKIIQEWVALIESMGTAADTNGSSRPATHLRSRTSSGSDMQTTPSHGSLPNRVSRGSPLRPPRSSSSSGGVFFDADEFVRIEWNNYQSMVQEIVSLKTSLLRLKRVLQEAEVLNPFDTSIKVIIGILSSLLNIKVNFNIFMQQCGLYYNLANSEAFEKRDDSEEGRDDPTLQEENIDLRRQIVFLQQQMNDKDVTIHLLQQQMSKYTGTITQVPCTEPLKLDTDGLAACAPTAVTVTTTNVATQTERFD